MFNLIVTNLTKIFSKKIFQKLNFVILHIILKFMGYKNFGNYNETGEKFFLDKLKNFKISTSIDIGANIGLYSKKLLEISNKKVISFEPMLQSFYQLQKLQKKNKDKFFCYNLALSNKHEYKDIHYPGTLSQLATISSFTKNIKFLKKYKFKKKKIKTVTLDSFLNKRKKLLNDGLDFIKIDTEGNDFNVILGSFKTINKFKPKFIQFEMNSHNLFEGHTLYKFKKLLNNYKIYRLLPFRSGLLSVNEAFAENNIFHLSIYILIRKNIQWK